MQKITACLILLLFAVNSHSQDIRIIPEPVSVVQPAKKGLFFISSATVIVTEGSNLDDAAVYLRDYIKEYYGETLAVTASSSSKNAIRLNYERLDHSIPGAYRLKAAVNGISIGGDNAEGVFYGIQTLIQLMPLNNSLIYVKKNQLTVPFIEISDFPRFAYRGMHLDVGRHFFPVSFVKKYIDFLALHKMNVFHWHLTEDQGWRIAIDKYPALTTTGSKRNGSIKGKYPGTGSDNNPHGGFYTKDEIKEVIAYARSRYIDVIPEIEMPGHSSAAIAAYPWLSCFPEKTTALSAAMKSAVSATEQQNGRIKIVQETWGVFDDVFCAGKESTFTFLENVIDEVTALFPSPYFHIGGDECPKTHWKSCPACQQRMKENNLKDEHELQSYFVQRIEKYLNSKGKTLIGWDEILEGGLAPNAVVMSWRGEAGGIEAAKQQHKVIMTPGNPVYFDHSQSENEDSLTIGGYNPIEKVYAWDPVPDVLTPEQQKFIIGAQANVWTEYMDNPAKVEYMIFPRMAALSEVLWSPASKRNKENFEHKLLYQFGRYEQWKVNYSKAWFDLKTEVISTATGLKWKITGKKKGDNIVYKRGDNRQFISYQGPIPVTGNETLYAQLSSGRGATIHQTFILHKATGKKITLSTPASKSYPGNGAFTLVDGIQNEKALAKSKEFLGFSGTDCDATIDLVLKQSVNQVLIHTLNQTGSWIWKPGSAEVQISANGSDWTSAGSSSEFVPIPDSPGNGVISINLSGTKTRYLRVIVKNYGTIPVGEPGAGNKAWLFVDEIEVK